MRKENGQYVQYLPVTTVSDVQLPVVAMGRSFIYLGRLFNANMCTEEAKEQLVCKLDLMLKIQSNTRIKPHMKIKIVKMVIFPRISFELKSYNFSRTWFSEVLDEIGRAHV